MHHRVVISKGSGDKRQFLSSDRGNYRWINDHEKCDDFEEEYVAQAMIDQLRKQERFNTELKIALVFKSFSRRLSTQQQ